MYDVLPATKPVVFTHHARRYVYRYDDCSRSIDVLYDRSICIFERALQARTEQAVYDEHVFVKSGWNEFVDDFMQFCVTFFQAFSIDCTIGRQVIFGVEEVTIDRITALCEHTGYGEGIAPIISGAGKNNDLSAIVPLVDDFSGNCRSSPFHQINGGDRLVVDGIAVYLLYLFGRKYLHIILQCIEFHPNKDNIFLRISLLCCRKTVMGRMYFRFSVKSSDSYIFVTIKVCTFALFYKGNG